MHVYATVDWSRVRRLVLVCTGNICRSPYAEVRARHLGLPAVSFGLAAAPGAPADPSAISNAAKRGVDLTSHRSRARDDVELCAHDLLVGMEPRQLPPLIQLQQRTGAQLTLQGLWAPRRISYVPDPHCLSNACFHYSYTLIDTSLARIAVLMQEAKAVAPVTTEAGGATWPVEKGSVVDG